MAHKSASQKEITKKNIRRKEEQKIHQCNVCANRFIHASSLKKHEEVIHKQMNDFKCDLCEKLFSDIPELKRHIEAIHEKITYKCEMCSKVYTSKSYLTLHKKNHYSNGNVRQYKCKVCGKDFKEVGSLKFHLKSIHLKIKQQSFSHANQHS